jgi:hypothetical protein
VKPGDLIPVRVSGVRSWEAKVRHRDDGGIARGRQPSVGEHIKVYVEGLTGVKSRASGWTS